MEEFSLSIDQASIATITWDLNGKSMNVMTQKGSEEFYALIDKVIDDQNIRGVIITSGKKDFAGGMDLSVLSELNAKNSSDSSAQIFNFIMKMHEKLRKLELAGMDPKTNKGGKPVGFITSPWYHPEKETNIAMGYVPFEGNLNSNGFPLGNFGKKSIFGPVGI